MEKPRIEKFWEI